jgi:hypothetical protein
MGSVVCGTRRGYQEWDATRPRDIEAVSEWDNQGMIRRAFEMLLLNGTRSCRVPSDPST